MKILRENDILKAPSKLVKTGYRMLKILRLLIEKPCSYASINEAFENDPYLKKRVSDDMICLYINSLRKIGCDISRPAKSNSFCYVLNSHSFSFKISKQDSKIIEIILKNLVKTSDWRLLLEVCEAFEELKKYSSKDSDLNFLRVISSFLRMDFDLAKKLNYYCEKEKYLVLDYLSPNSGLKEISLLAQNLSLENSKMYFWGYNCELKELQYLRLDRIKKIKVISFADMNMESLKFPKVVYKLLNQDIENFVPDEFQKILAKQEKEIVIEEEMKNKFKFIQKILSYAGDCVVLEPEYLKKEVLASIKSILEQYE